MHHNLFIGQELDNNVTIENDDTSETSNGTQRKKDLGNFYMQELYMF